MNGVQNMEHKGTVRLETERLVLRQFVESDAAAAYRNWTGDDEVTKYLTWPSHANEEMTAYVINNFWIANYKEDNFYQWAIEVKEIKEPIGTISVVNSDDLIGMFEIGYCIGKNWWNKGIVTEAFKEVIRFLFEEVKANRIQARHDPANPGSGIVMKKCGLQYEGTLRKADKNNTGIVDVAIYGILAEEYWKEEK